jgi:callose synthase
MQVNLPGQNLGDVKDFSDIRRNFEKMPHAFCTKIVAENPNLSHASSSNMLSSIDNPSILNDFPADESTGLLNAANTTDRNSFQNGLQQFVNDATKRLLDVRIQKWVFFSAAWNEIIDHFREEDIISNKEMGNLKFSRFPHFKQPIYLPVFQTAGVVDQCVRDVETAIDEQVRSGWRRGAGFAR